MTCEQCVPDIEAFYDGISEALELNQKLVDMAVRHPQGSKLLSSGRVIVLRDNVSLLPIPPIRVRLTRDKHFHPSNIGVLLKAAPLQTLVSGRIDQVKTYFVLALVHPEVKSGDRGEFGFR